MQISTMLIITAPLPPFLLLYVIAVLNDKEQSRHQKRQLFTSWFGKTFLLSGRLGKVSSEKNKHNVVCVFCPVVILNVRRTAVLGAV